MSIRTLIVDDEEMGRRTLRQLLTEYTPSLHVVAEVATTSEARRAILEHAPDINGHTWQAGAFNNYYNRRTCDAYRDAPLRTLLSPGVWW